MTFTFHADGSSFVSPAFLQASDLGCALIKSTVFGFFIPLAAASRGLAARNGAAAVGEAVTDGVVYACLGVLTLDFLIELAFMLVGA